MPIKTRQVPLLDLRAQHATIRDEVIAAIMPIIDSQQLIMGAAIEELERGIAAYSHARFAIACASGSDALLLAWMALGIRPGDKVLTTPFSFFASAGSISRMGAIPVFADIREDTFNIDEEQIEAALRKYPGIKAIQPVHLFGACAEMNRIAELGREYGAMVVEDAAQSIGAEHNGRRCGALGDIGCFSFFPSKNLGAYGDAGMLTTNNEALAARLSILRIHGGKNKYFHELAGINSRMDTLQAAVLNVKLRRLDDWTAARQRNAGRYRELLSGLVPVQCPRALPYQTRHVVNQFSIQCDRRDALKKFLFERGIATEIYYPLPLHLQKCFADLGYKAGDFPVSERVASRVLSLPVYPELPAEDLEYVADSIHAFYV